MSTGKVWLVGAGPGDVGLLTRKAEQVIREADLIVYDALVGDGVFSLLPKDAEYISVGKRSGNHTMPQEKIDQVLLEQAQQGKKVVRLKGGDPFLFGRGGEELELLAQHGIPYEVVPGITSPIAVPAYNGIPVTHRDYTSSLHIITGHKRKGQDYDIDFEALVRTKGTLVFLMGIAMLPVICKGLIDGGMAPDMPAAVLQQGTTAGQKRVVATVSTLHDEVQKQGIETPAIIVVGKVCQLADQFAWYEKLPLAGWRVVVTRPSGMISTMSARLRKLGAEVLEMPSIETVPREDQTPLLRALERVSDYQWLVFTSPTGVRVFFEAMREGGVDIRSLAGLKLAAIGAGTRKELAERGLNVDFLPSVYDGDTLGRELAAVLRREAAASATGDDAAAASATAQFGTTSGPAAAPADWRPVRILLPRAAVGNQTLVDELLRAGAQVDDIPTYDTVNATASVLDERKLFEDGKVDCAVFTSASSVRGFVAQTEGLDYNKVRAACIGRQTKAAADALGMQTRMAERATMDSLTKLVVAMKGERTEWK